LRDEGGTGHLSVGMTPTASIISQLTDTIRIDPISAARKSAKNHAVRGVHAQESILTSVHAVEEADLAVESIPAADVAHAAEPVSVHALVAVPTARAADIGGIKNLAPKRDAAEAAPDVPQENRVGDLREEVQDVLRGELREILLEELREEEEP
jgi:hypothetical protein